MSDDLHDLDELLDEIKGMTIRTTQGSFVKEEDLRRLIEKRKQAGAIDQKTLPQPKNVAEAREQAKAFLAERAKESGLPAPKPSLGRAVPASEAQPSSRT